MSLPAIQPEGKGKITTRSTLPKEHMLSRPFPSGLLSQYRDEDQPLVESLTCVRTARFFRYQRPSLPTPCRRLVELSMSL